MDVLLIQPPIRDFYHTSKRTIPYGLACIASSLIREGFSVDILDALATSKSKPITVPDHMTYLNELYSGQDKSPFALFSQYRHFGYSYDEIKKRIQTVSPFLVGISSLFTPYYKEALQIAKIVKSIHSQCYVVLGGHHPTAFPESVLECPAVDFVIQGEGELSLPMLVKSLQKGDNFDHIPGIAYRKSDGHIYKNPLSVVEHIDQLPLPALNLIRHSFYQRKKAGSTVIVTSRGCPMKCSYCAVGHSGIPYRRKSIDSVISEIEHAINSFNVRFIDFEDENLSFNSQWFSSLLDEIQTRFSHHSIECRAMNGLFPSTLTESLIKKMKAAGFKTLNLSVGALSPYQQQRFNRPDLRTDLDNILCICRTHQMEAVCYLIAGAPYQDPKQTISDMISLFFKGVLIGVSIFYPAPGTPDYLICQQRGLLPNDFSLFRSSAIPISDVTTRKNAVTIMRLGRILNFMKYLVDINDSIPSPQLYQHEAFLPITDRTHIGKILLSWFLNDGIIRGITPDGYVFAHAVSHELTSFFLDEYWKYQSIKHL